MENKNIKTFEIFTQKLNEFALSTEDYSRFDKYFKDIMDFKKSHKNINNEFYLLKEKIKKINYNDIYFEEVNRYDFNYKINFGNDVNSLIFSINTLLLNIKKSNMELYEYISNEYFNGGLSKIDIQIDVESDRFNKFHFPVSLPFFLKRIGIGKKIILSAINNFDYLYFNSEEDSNELKIVVKSITERNDIFSFMLDNKIFIFKDDFSFIKIKLKEIFKHFTPENYSLDVDFKKKYDSEINKDEFLIEIFNKN
jgi:hypothetical protein